jgi:hypothetical protein
MLDRDLHGGNIARWVVRTLELRRPGHRSNNRSEYPRDAPATPSYKAPSPVPGRGDRGPAKRGPPAARR